MAISSRYFKKSHVRSQDSVTIICAVAANITNKNSSELAWEFIKQNWPVIYERYSSGFNLARLVKVTII